MPRKRHPRFAVGSAGLGNDTDLERFYLENRRFPFFAGIFVPSFLRSVAAHRFSNVPFRKSFRFPAKPTKFVIARRAFSMPDAAILNGTRRHPGTKHGKACAKWRFRGSTDVVSPCDKSKFRDYIVLCPRASFRDAIPMALRLPRRCAPRNDTELERFYLRNRRFSFLRAFL